MNRITSTLTLALGILLASPLLAGCTNTAPGKAPTPPTTQAASVEAPLSNADVIKLCKLDLGNDIIIAKINQAKAVDFKLDLDGLIGLKQGGVGKDVIAAMLKRATPMAENGSGQESRALQEPEFMGIFYWLDPASGRLSPLERQTPERVSKSVHIEGIGGGSQLMQLMGEKSPLRFKEGQSLEFVVMVPSQTHDPQELIQFYSMESKKDKRLMITRVSSSGFFTNKSKSLTNESEIPFNASKYGRSCLKVAPVQGLLPGEYVLSGPSIRDGFCFGIDADPSNPSSRAERTVPFRTGEAIPLGIVERLVTVHSVEVTAWPKAAELQKAEALPEGTTSLTVKFTYSNQGAREWKCRYRVAVLDDKGAEIGLGERDASLDGNQKSDTNRVSVKMRTLDFPKAAKLLVRVLPRLN